MNDFLKPSVEQLEQQKRREQERAADESTAGFLFQLCGMVAMGLAGGMAAMHASKATMARLSAQGLGETGMKQVSKNMFKIEPKSFRRGLVNAGKSAGRSALRNTDIVEMVDENLRERESARAQREKERRNSAVARRRKTRSPAA